MSNLEWQIGAVRITRIDVVLCTHLPTTSWIVSLSVGASPRQSVFFVTTCVKH